MKVAKCIIIVAIVGVIGIALFLGVHHWYDSIKRYEYACDLAIKKAEEEYGGEYYLVSSEYHPQKSQRNYYFVCVSTANEKKYHIVGYRVWEADKKEDFTVSYAYESKPGR